MHGYQAYTGTFSPSGQTALHFSSRRGAPAQLVAAERQYHHVFYRVARQGDTRIHKGFAQQQRHMHCLKYAFKKEQKVGLNCGKLLLP
jgi:hypothetical protein